MSDPTDRPAPAGTRLNKYLAQCGVASRRRCDELIAAGHVAVNGQTVREMGVRVAEGDAVSVRGQAVRPEAEKHYLLYHKPAGEVTTVADDRGRPTVLDRFADYPVRVFPVGRLDYDSEGLLLLTNDGELAHRLLHPSQEVEKAYLARITGVLGQEALRTLRQGVLMEGETRPTAPARVQMIRQEAFASVVLVGLREGRNRQVRRMFDAVGHRVLSLRRVAFGPLRLGGLARGAFRALTPPEVDEIRRL
ncbi:MAG: rRNA pseudouridine synthase [Clostridia bacterium]|nr:rRNA pseudouridine synthase [Clostridia bacterium]